MKTQDFVLLGHSTRVLAAPVVLGLAARWQQKPECLGPLLTPKILTNRLCGFVFIWRISLVSFDTFLLFWRLT